MSRSWRTAEAVPLGASQAFSSSERRSSPEFERLDVEPPASKSRKLRVPPKLELRRPGTVPAQSLRVVELQTNFRV